MTEVGNPAPYRYEPTPNQLRAGYELGSDETIVFDITPQAGFSPDVDPATVDNTDEHSPVAMIVFGSAMALVQARRNAGGYWYMLHDGHSYSHTIETPFLKRGEFRSLGRSFPGQKYLPAEVSRDHCALGLDADGRLVVENHNPKNQTTVYRLESGTARVIIDAWLEGEL